ncbi:response regulator [Noviherbaspirillum sp.]|uniref:response regulator n=1 Tax=Noviherbaspirillum sp. TaxID=1926288 RepID=UPI002D71A945|nr:response regulator [Noviherbaspirillum sp.]HZW23258.1 response regulator [Noviherbaspirillum sp.]
MVDMAFMPALPGEGTLTFVIELLGFPDPERRLLASTFRLTDRRRFSYVYNETLLDRPDIYLVNSDSPRAMETITARPPNALSPAVYVGRHVIESQWPFIEKPIQWSRLFQTLDAQMTAALAARAARPAPEGWDGIARRRFVDRYLVPAPITRHGKTESVLVVDDSATVRAFMRTKLAPFEFDVDYAVNGETAIEMAQAKHYTCIFLDILMPGMDGYQVCKRLKSSPATKAASVVMLSSKTSPFDKFRGTWAGCDAYLGKPVNDNDLLDAIIRFLPSGRSLAESVLANSR